MSPVPPHLVHRSDEADVLLTHFGRADADTYLFTVQWPTTHALFSSVLGQENPMLIAETVRQAGTVLAHEVFEAPMDDQFLLWNLRYESFHDLRRPGGPPTPTKAVIRSPEVTLRGRRLATIHIDMELFSGHLRIGTGSASANCLSAAAYRRLRPGLPDASDVSDVSDAHDAPVPAVAPRTAIPPTLVGKKNEQDVMLSPFDSASPLDTTTPSHAPAAPLDTAPTPPAAPWSGARPAGTPRTAAWQLRADRHHPVIFDSQSDHLPGRGIIEAMRQAAQLAAGLEHALVPSMNAEFRRYVELDRPCTVSTEVGAEQPDGRIPIEVTMYQDNEVAALALLLVQDVKPAARHDLPVRP
ncbi:ScbA/BarX family gamma-butyrolactone biosynthesis protein [Streptomyces sp. BE308]|uniref:ScbA/BarX family gamma-butyrolactone biosynthesis protein n=1 Tax=Streptomyces sp. BE308 TaxID=3002529 RepID=UPI002E777D76|nr:ScbA/BarX family gamma-butyrolactone biosynthesis protein [Streptomyces sp. BE308]MEE1795122.1 ScbA/BarX family gamma-butyrolactone biosynthesis protein [Streptomyces sp. BE308]